MDGVDFNLDEKRRALALEMAVKIMFNSGSTEKVLRAAREFEAYLKDK
jgi:hypothetical protein